MTAGMQRPYRKGVLGHPQRTMPLVRKITFKQIVEVLFQCFFKELKQHFKNLFERNLATWDIFLHIFFVTKSTTFLV